MQNITFHPKAHAALDESRLLLASRLRDLAKAYDERASLAPTLAEADGLAKTSATLRFVATLHVEGILDPDVTYAFLSAGRHLLSDLTVEPTC